MSKHIRDLGSSNHLWFQDRPSEEAGVCGGTFQAKCFSSSAVTRVPNPIIAMVHVALFSETLGVQHCHQI